MSIGMMRGISGSGKTTVAREWVAESPGKRVRVSRDDIRAMLFGAPGWDIDEHLVSQVETAAVLRAVASDISVIVDACHLNYNYETRWRNWAKRYNVGFVVLDVDVDVELAIERDRQREFPVGEKVIRQQAEKRAKLFKYKTSW